MSVPRHPSCCPRFDCGVPNYLADFQQIRSSLDERKISVFDLRKQHLTISSVTQSCDVGAQRQETFENSKEVLGKQQGGFWEEAGKTKADSKEA